MQFEALNNYRPGLRKDYRCAKIFHLLCYHTIQPSPKLLLPLAYIKMKTPLFLDLLTSLNYSPKFVVCNNFSADSSDFYWLVQKRNNASLLIQVRSIQTYCTVYTIHKLLQHVLTNICSHLWGVPEVGINLISTLLNTWKMYNIKCMFSVLKLFSKHIFIICPTYVTYSFSFLNIRNLFHRPVQQRFLVFLKACTVTVSKHLVLWHL